MPTLEEQPAARPVCDHHWIGHLRGGEPLSVRICSLCGDPDWADLRRQAEDFAREAAAAALDDHGSRLGRVLAEMEDFDTRRPTLALVIEGLAQDAALRRHVALVLDRLGRTD